MFYGFCSGEDNFFGNSLLTLARHVKSARGQECFFPFHTFAQPKNEKKKNQKKSWVSPFLAQFLLHYRPPQPLSIWAVFDHTGIGFMMKKPQTAILFRNPSTFPCYFQPTKNYNSAKKHELRAFRQIFKKNDLGFEECNYSDFLTLEYHIMRNVGWQLLRSTNWSRERRITMRKKNIFETLIETSF